jgi:sugar/nucleoside kinase (ribokinase family)
MTNRRVAVFGPAYLDRLLRVDRPLRDPAQGPPIDQSVEGVCKFGTADTLDLVDPAGSTIAIELPSGWPGPIGEIHLARPIPNGVRGRRVVRGLTWQDDLGGMGAGYAAVLHGRLTSALGPESDATSQAIVQRLAHRGIAHQPVRVPGFAADWTLLITSGAFGDKLPIGFRGCHAALTPPMLAPMAAEPCDLRVVAALSNPLAARLLMAPGARTRFFAPAMRNMLDGDCPVPSFAAAIDVLSCNRREWEALEPNESIAWLVSILVVTDGAEGSSVRFTTPTGEPGRFHIPAFPRNHPPRDTNRAGETYASTLVATLLDHGWNAGSGVVEEALIRMAAERAAAAAALVLDRLEFGFPTPEEIDAALRIGRVA